MPGPLNRQRVIDVDNHTTEPGGATSAAVLHGVG